jgi:hypothetical protein
MLVTIYHGMSAITFTTHSYYMTQYGFKFDFYYIS